MAAELLAAFEDRQYVKPITSRLKGFGSDEAYEVLDHIDAARIAKGWRPAGRKIGFTNRDLWPSFGVDRPMWATIWEETIVHAEPGEGRAAVSVSPFVQPRLEPEIVLGLDKPVTRTDDPLELLSSVAWIAPGFEIVQCLFEGWRFDSADCTAAFGLHGALAIGDRVDLNQDRGERIAEWLADFTVELERDGELVDHGSGSNVLGSPLTALCHLVSGLATRGDALRAGDIVTTGTLTNAWPIEPGDVWRATYTGADFVSFEISIR